MDSCGGLTKTFSEKPGARGQRVKAAGENIHNYSTEVFVRNFVAAYQRAVNGGVS